MAFGTFEIATQNTLTTTDAVAHTILTAQMVPNSSATVVVTATARNPATGDTKGWHITQTLKRGASGAATVVGAAGNLMVVNDTNAASWSFSLTTIGDSLTMQATGAAATTIDWYAEASGMVVT